jgi:hypothetical protein
MANGTGIFEFLSLVFRKSILADLHRECIPVDVRYRACAMDVTTAKSIEIAFVLLCACVGSGGVIPLS